MASPGGGPVEEELKAVWGGEASWQRAGRWQGGWRLGRWWQRGVAGGGEEGVAELTERQLKSR